MSFEPHSIEALRPVNQHVSVAQYGSDKGLFVEFYHEKVLQEFESTAAGRQIFKAVPHIIIHYSGGKSDLRRKVKMEDDQHSPSDPHRFPRQWEAFQANQSQSQSGTPLEMVPWLTVEQVWDLKAQHIQTVEQLANLPDSGIGGMGWRDLRDRAQKFVAASTGDHAVVSQLEAENKNMKTDMEAMKAQLAEMSAMLMEKRGPGRPRKEVTNGTES